jgi:hypothetical protein
MYKREFINPHDKHVIPGVQKNILMELKDRDYLLWLFPALFSASRKFSKCDI